MSTRATRSKQRAVEIASLSPAKSTRSGGRSASPALNVSLRSSSPASRRSASPANSAHNVITRGRGAGARGRGRCPKAPPTRASPTPPRVGRSRPGKQQATRGSATAKRGRGRGRGRGRATKAKELPEDDQVSDVVSEHDLSHDKSGEVDESMDIEQSTDQADKSAESDEIAAVTENETTAEKQDDSEIDNEPLAQSMQSGSSEAAAIAEIASHLASDSVTDQWPDDPENITFTAEHIQQLESVLSSDEGLKLLADDQQNTEELTEDSMTLDDKVIQVSLAP